MTKNNPQNKIVSRADRDEMPDASLDKVAGGGRHLFRAASRWYPKKPIETAKAAPRSRRDWKCVEGLAPKQAFRREGLRDLHKSGMLRVCMPGPCLGATLVASR